MKPNSFKILASLLCSWFAGFALGLWCSTPYITDREAGLVIAILAIVAISVVFKCVSADETIGHLSHEVGEMHTTAMLDLQNAHRKHVMTIKSTEKQNMREAQQKIRRVTLDFDRLNSEYDFISNMYQDQARLNLEQEHRIDFLEKKLKESRRHGSASLTAPFSAPASQTNFAKPPLRGRATAVASSPLSQEPMVQEPEGEEN